MLDLSRMKSVRVGPRKFRGEGAGSTKWDFGFDIFHRRQGNHPHQLLGFGLAGPVGRELVEDTTLVAKAFVGAVTICTGVDCRFSIDWYRGSRWFWNRAISASRTFMSSLSGLTLSVSWDGRT